MDIERKAVTKIEDVISSCDYLESQISTNDKGVSWDGFIYVYKKRGDVHEKKDLYKSVRVQIKGQKKNVVKSESIKYPVQIADLRNYLTEGGTVFFVVYINNERNEYQIYFKSLLPVDIKPILKKYGKQKSRMLVFSPFPSDADEVSELFVNIAANMKKQMPFAGDEEIITLEELEKEAKPINLTFSYATISNHVNTTTSVFFDYDQYIYVKNSKGTEIPVGNRKIYHRDSIISIPIYVKGQKFYDRFTLRNTKDEIIYKIGKGVFFRTKCCDKLSAKFEFEFSGNLKERLKDVEFVCAFLSQGSLTIGEEVIIDSLDDIADENIDKNSLFRHLHWLQDVKQMLNLISFKEEFEYDKVSSEDVKWLCILVDCFVRNKNVNLVSDGTGLTNIQIAGHNLKFFVKHISSEGNNTIITLNKFKGKIERKGKDGKLYQVSLYSLLTKADFLTCSNIDCDALLKQTKQVPISNVFAWELNRLLLDIVSAWDEASERNDLLEDALKLAEWIRNEVDFIPKEISTLNFYQIVKRRRELNDAENAELLQLLDDPDLTPDCCMAAHLLLGEHHSARRCFCKLTPEQQENYRQMPIFRFWKGEN